jgi:chemotaxis protein methyltransferase CheR
MKTLGPSHRKLPPELAIPFDDFEMSRHASESGPGAADLRVSTAQFEQFANLAYQRAGIRLGPGKEALVGARIGKRIRALSLRSPGDYLEYLLQNDQGEELTQFLDVISTNFTSFFRESEHFPLLGDLVEQRVRQGHNRMRFWSAACSSGEEPYTMALCIAERLANRTVDWRILATDISTKILATAKAGQYCASTLKNVPKRLRLEYFDPVSPRGSDDPVFSVKDVLKSHVAFERLNLSTPPFPMRGPIDAVMCRNVMIYFDRSVRQRLVSAIERLLAVDGIFFIGHAETLNGLDTHFRAIRPSVYVLPGSAFYPVRKTSFSQKGSPE